MRYHNWSAFTLVEIIVVIVILSILWTIWAISFIRENSDARDAVRYTDITQLSKNINLNLDSWKIASITNIIEQQKENNTLTWGYIMSGYTLTWSSYTVWIIDTIELGDNKVYIDPKLKIPYIVGTIQWDFWKYFQVSWSLENNTAIVQWNYYQKTLTDNEWIIKSVSGSSIVINGWNFLPY